MDSSCIRGLYGATMAQLYNHANFRIREKGSSLEGKVPEYLSVKMSVHFCCNRVGKDIKAYKFKFNSKRNGSCLQTNEVFSPSV